MESLRRYGPEINSQYDNKLDLFMLVPSSNPPPSLNGGINNALCGPYHLIRVVEVG